MCTTAGCRFKREDRSRIDPAGAFVSLIGILLIGLVEIVSALALDAQAVLCYNIKHFEVRLASLCFQNTSSSRQRCQDRNVTRSITALSWQTLQRTRVVPIRVPKMRLPEASVRQSEPPWPSPSSV